MEMDAKTRQPLTDVQRPDAYLMPPRRLDSPRQLVLPLAKVATAVLAAKEGWGAF